MSMKINQKTRRDQSTADPKPLRRDLFLLVAGGAVSLTTAAAVMYWQTERANAEQRHHKRIESLREFNLQIGRLYDKAENTIDKCMGVIDQVEKTYKARGHATAEDGRRLIELGTEMLDFGADNYAQIDAAAHNLNSYFGKDVVDNATPSPKRPFAPMLAKHREQRSSLQSRVAAAATQDAKNRLIPELVATSRAQFAEYKEVIEGERERIQSLNEALMRIISRGS